VSTALPRRIEGTDRIRIPVAATSSGAAAGSQLEAVAEIGPDHPAYAQWDAFLLGQERAAGMAEHTKAATPEDDADPKAQAAGAAIPPPDERWPAWAVDTALTAATVAAIQEAMAAGLAPFSGPAGLVAAFLNWASGQDRTLLNKASVLGWLRSIRLRFDLPGIIRSAIAQAAAIGSRSAITVMAQGPEGVRFREPGFTMSTDWGGWTPGDVGAARRVLSEDGLTEWLSDLLERSGVRIEQIAANRVDEVASVLADGLERGASVNEIATALRGILDDRNWATMVAWTETNRAQSAAALERYRGRGVTAVEWFTAQDQRVCKYCDANEAAGPVVLGMAFPSGETHPPAHPRCRCAILPVLEMPDFDELKSARAAATGHEGDAEQLHHYWTVGEGRAKWTASAHPWTTLYHHLLRHIGDPGEAKRTAAQWFHDALGFWPGHPHHGVVPD